MTKAKIQGVGDIRWQRPLVQDIACILAFAGRKLRHSWDTVFFEKKEETQEMGLGWVVYFFQRNER